MKTPELVEALSSDLPPIGPHAVEARLARGIGVGAAVSFLAMWMWLGFRPDLSSAAMTADYWMKFAYTLALAVFAFWAIDRLARPARTAGLPSLGLALVVAVLFAIAIAQLMASPPGARHHLMMGSSASVCPWRIAALSLPIFVGTFWSLRALAPTRLVLAGAIAGLGSGALGAWVYAFHCDESAMPFVAIFYTLAMVLMGAVGAALARRILRW